MKLVSDLQREALLQMLREYDGTPDSVVVAKTAETINVFWADQPVESWEEVSELFRKAFKLDDSGATTILAGGTLEPDERPVKRPDFREVVNTGWFGDYLEYASVGEAPSQFNFGSALAFLAAGLQRQPRIAWEAQPTFPNLYILLVGPTGARKGSAVKRAQSLIVPVLGTHVLPSEGTHQGFAEALRRRCNDTGNAEGLILAPEFRVLLSKDDRNKADMVTWLTDWYDAHESWSRALRGEPSYELTNVCVSLLGASNMAWLKRTPTDAVLGGFFPRFLILDQPEDEKIWGAALPKFNKTLETELQKRVENLLYCTPEVIGFDKSSNDWMEHWYTHTLRYQYENAVDEQVRTWLTRKQSTMLKMATVWQLIDDGPKDKLAVEWLEKAKAVCDWSDTTVASVFAGLGVTQIGEISQDLFDFIQRKGGRVPERQIVRSFRNKMSSMDVRKGLATLKDSREIRVETNASEGKVWIII